MYKRVYVIPHYDAALFFHLLNGYVSETQPITRIQLTASRARSLTFWQVVQARSRQLNGNPLGGQMMRASCEPV